MELGEMEPISVPEVIDIQVYNSTVVFMTSTEEMGSFLSCRSGE
jgi:hypothetical protein